MGQRTIGAARGDAGAASLRALAAGAVGAAGGDIALTVGDDATAADNTAAIGAFAVVNLSGGGAVITANAATANLGVGCVDGEGAHGEHACHGKSETFHFGSPNPRAGPMPAVMR